MVQTNVGSSMDEVKIEEAMFLLFGQDYRLASHEPSRGFRGKEHLDGTVEKGSLPMLQLKMLQARLTMSTT